MTNTNADQIAYWNEAAGRTWVDCQTLLDVQLEPLGLVALESLELAPGSRVLDVGCGCGDTTLALADRVGADGRAVGADISQPMLEIARRRSAERPQASYIAADAQTYDFGQAAYDAVYSRFGVMFFEDPKAAFANLRRALKPGGRLAFTCWRTPAENPLMIAPLQAAQPFLPPSEPPPANAPGPFAFADANRVRGILEAAGFGDIGIAPQDMPAGGNDVAGAVDLALRVGPLGRMLREHPQAAEDAVGAVRQLFGDAAGPDGRVFLDSATWVVTGRNP